MGGADKQKYKGRLKVDWDMWRDEDDEDKDVDGTLPPHFDHSHGTSFHIRGWLGHEQQVLVWREWIHRRSVFFPFFSTSSTHIAYECRI